MSLSRFRTEIIGDATLILGDCREVLPTLGKVDAVVTDPPYGIGYSHSGGGRGIHSMGVSRTSTDAVIGDDEPFDPRPFLIADRVALFGADHYANLLPSGGMFHVWDKDPKAALQWDSFSDAELFWTNWTSKRRVIRFLWKGLCQAGAGQRREHPTAKPVEVMRLVCELVGGKSILDPFMGSGTTGVACMNLGRRFTGIEIHEPYFDIACRRIEQAWKQPRLFEEPAPKPVQESLLWP